MEIERSHWSIVLLGSFNPAIFHPAWFELHGVISKDVASAAEVNVVHNEISNMTLGDIVVTAEVGKFQVATSNAPEIRLLDFISVVFGDVLPHSKVRSFGVNKSTHFRAISAERRIEMGRRLAPLHPWGAFGERLAASEGDELGGMMSLRMREILNDEDSSGHLEVRIEPSNALDRRTGIFVAVNRHFDLKDDGETVGAKAAVSKLDQSFVASLEKADEIINHFAEMAS